MGKSIYEEALEDVKLLKETAVENAKNVLVEAISPKIKEFVETQLGETELKEEPDSAGEKKEMYEEAEGGNVVHTKDSIGEMKDKDSMDEAKEEMDEAKDSQEEPEKVEEVVEITTEDLKKAFSEILQNEATVTKSFGDMQNATIKNAGGKGEKGIADEKAGEHNWNDVMPPDGKDWSVKEAFYKKQLTSLSRQFAGLKKENMEYKKALSYLKRNLQEVNLFNGKLIYTNKVLQSAQLTNKQRVGVIEAFDRARTLREVELVYKSLSESLKIAGVVSEAKKTLAAMKGPKASRPTSGSGSTSSTLKEGLEKEDSSGQLNRWQQLAGLSEMDVLK